MVNGLHGVKVDREIYPRFYYLLHEVLVHQSLIFFSFKRNTYNLRIRSAKWNYEIDIETLQKFHNLNAVGDTIISTTLTSLVIIAVNIFIIHKPSGSFRKTKRETAKLFFIIYK